MALRTFNRDSLIEGSVEFAALIMDKVWGYDSRNRTPRGLYGVFGEKIFVTAKDDLNHDDAANVSQNVFVFVSIERNPRVFGVSRNKCVFRSLEIVLGLTGDVNGFYTIVPSAIDVQRDMTPLKPISCLKAMRTMTDREACVLQNVSEDLFPTIKIF